eukprot:CAMPEP_0169123754 /NCGR_PEP_ID=MMETSP1015-20121227/33958_1 /TAXON_ID=342587 /ORGANISM="Karlodinium micrum, Strain CCMP2283" /LENGTH=169 /DNA_ID=CAMNT_0009187121 /DNA_START=67 /DNA_END=577 /DNA_ORIENTATION=+
MGRSRSRSRGDGGADAQKIQALVDERNDARRERDWDRADKLRDELREMGVSFNDTNGTWTGPGGLSGQTGHAKGAGKGSKGRDRSDDRGRDDRRGGGAAMTAHAVSVMRVHRVAVVAETIRGDHHHVAAMIHVAEVVDMATVVGVTADMMIVEEMIPDPVVGIELGEQP